MTVSQLLSMLKEAHPDAKVTASDIYGEGEFEITGMEYTDDNVVLTGEELG